MAFLEWVLIMSLLENGGVLGEVEGLIIKRILCFEKVQDYFLQCKLATNLIK